MYQMAVVSNVQFCHCNNCGGERRHTIIHSEKVDRHINADDPVFFITHTMTYTSLKCGGCEAVQLKTTDSVSGVDKTTVRYYPAHMPRQLPEWMHQLDVLKPEHGYIFEMLEEIYSALAAGASTVSAMGVRALLEFIMVSKVGDQGSFAQNLDEFETQGYVAKRERTRLAQILDVGSAAIHRAFMVAPADALILLDIAEHVVESIYIHDDVVANVSKKVPPRAARAPTKTNP